MILLKYTTILFPIKFSSFFKLHFQITPNKNLFSKKSMFDNNCLIDSDDIKKGGFMRPSAFPDHVTVDL